MKIRLIFILFVSLLAAALPCRAEKQQENRFLFIIDNSGAMRGYSNEVVQAVAELMNSDMRGEFRNGDTIGLWTYNDRLNTEFPMQVWTKAAKSGLLEGMSEYLQGLSYAKFSHPDRAMTALREVVKASDRITAIWISDGRTSIHGTPFDKEINALEKKYRPDLRASHVPFILVLAARGGAIFDYTINYPAALAIPHMATDEVAPPTNAPVVAAVPAVTNIPAPKPLRSLIMSAVRPQVHTNPPTPVQPALAEAPQPAPATTPALPAVPQAKTEPVKQIEAQPARTIAPESAPTPAAQTPPTPVAAPAPETPVPVVAAAAPGGNQPILFVIAFLLLIIALALVIVLVKRSRSSHEPSLISQSINRPR